MTTLTVENLTYSYNSNDKCPHYAISDVSFTANSGDIIGIIGHTGSGKSTLVSHFNGLLKPESGRVLLNGTDIWVKNKRNKALCSKIGLVFQYPEYQLFDETVYKDIAFGPKNIGLIGEDLNKAVLSAALAVGLNEEYLEKSPFDLSGGEKRRVAIAGVLAMQPEIIVFDEPTAGLDPQGRETVINIIKNYHKNNNAIVFIVSHSMEDIAQIANKVLVMNNGKSVCFDTPESVFSNREMLIECGLDVPLVTRVIAKLKNKGITLNNPIITVDDAVKEIIALKKGGNSNA